VGDQVRPFNLLPVYGSFRQPLTLDVQRGTELLPITFLPQSGQVEAWEWVAAPGAMPIGKP